MSRWVRAAEEQPPKSGLYMVRRRMRGRRRIEEDVCRYDRMPAGGCWLRPKGKGGFAPTDTVEEWLREGSGDD